MKKMDYGVWNILARPLLSSGGGVPRTEGSRLRKLPNKALDPTLKQGHTTMKATLSVVLPFHGDQRSFLSPALHSTSHALCIRKNFLPSRVSCLVLVPPRPSTTAHLVCPPRCINRQLSLHADTRHLCACWNCPTYNTYQDEPTPIKQVH